MNFLQWFDATVNPIFWIVANLSLFYIAVVMAMFVGLYFFRFKWREYSAGRSIMYFTASLLGIIILVVIGILSGGRAPWEYPPDIFWWRPALRAGIYGWVAFTVTHLLRVLWSKYREGIKLQVEFDPKTVPPRDTARSRR